MSNITKQTRIIVATSEVKAALDDCPVEKLINSINLAEGDETGYTTHGKREQAIWTETLESFKESFNEDCHFSKKIYMRIIQVVVVSETVINTAFEGVQEL